MGKRVFTTTDRGKKQTFEGFWRPFVTTMAFPKALAVVTVDGTVDLWGLEYGDVDLAIQELARYYRMDGHVVCGVDEDILDADTRIAVFIRNDRASDCAVAVREAKP